MLRNALDTQGLGHVRIVAADGEWSMWSIEMLSVGDMLKTVYIDRTSYMDCLVYMLTIGNSQTNCFKLFHIKDKEVHMLLYIISSYINLDEAYL